MTEVLEEIQHLDFEPPPADIRPVDHDRDPSVCGVCGLDKIKLGIKTAKQGLDIWVCTNIPEKQRMPCDGYVYKNAVYNGTA